MAFTREADGWHVVTTCDLGDVAVAPSTNPTAGIDLGLKAFLTTSDGESIPPPKFYRAAHRLLRRAQRHVSRCQKGSRRRHQARARGEVAPAHRQPAARLAPQDRFGLVCRYGTIAHETLNIQGLARTRLAKPTLDAGWAQFLGIPTHKAAGAGVAAVPVDTRNTTRACGACGARPVVPLTVGDRVYRCAPAAIPSTAITMPRGTCGTNSNSPDGAVRRQPGR